MPCRSRRELGDTRTQGLIWSRSWTHARTFPRTSVVFRAQAAEAGAKKAGKNIIHEGSRDGLKVVAKWRTERGNRMACLVKFEKLDTGKMRERQLVQVMNNKFESETDCAAFVGQLMEDVRAARSAFE